MCCAPADQKISHEPVGAPSADRTRPAPDPLRNTVAAKDQLLLCILEWDTFIDRSIDRSTHTERERRSLLPTPHCSYAREETTLPHTHTHTVNESPPRSGFLPTRAFLCPGTAPRTRAEPWSKCPFGSNPCRFHHSSRDCSHDDIDAEPQQFPRHVRLGAPPQAPSQRSRIPGEPGSLRPRNGGFHARRPRTITPGCDVDDAHQARDHPWDSRNAPDPSTDPLSRPEHPSGSACVLLQGPQHHVPPVVPCGQ